MSLILERLTASASSVRRQRAQIIDSQLRNKQLELISNLRAKCDSLDLEISNLMDIAPTATTSLKMENIDPQKLVESLPNLSTKLELEKMGLKIAEDNYKKWFSDGESAKMAQAQLESALASQAQTQAQQLGSTSESTAGATQQSVVQ